MRRCFVHPDGRTHSLEVVDCRVHESWSRAGARGQASVSTRGDDRDARTFAVAKIRKLLRDGFVETASEPGLVAGTAADVLQAYRSDVDHAGKSRYDFQPAPGRSHVYTCANASVVEWLVTSDDARLGIKLAASIWKSAQPPEERDAIASSLLDVLEGARDEILADRATPLRKLPLPSAAGRFTHLAILSPVAANETISENVSRTSYAIARSIHRAFPCFACEVTGGESVAVAEARCRGRGAIPIGSWNRDPHPVVDLAYSKRAGDPPEYLVHDPAELERRLGAAGLARSGAAEVLARNWRGEVRRITPSAPPDLAELRAFFLVGLGATPG